MTEIFTIFNIVVLLYIWLDTDAFIEYAELFHLSFFKYKEFRQKQLLNRLGTPLSYVDFISMEYNSFFVRLITCPICLTVWLTLLFSSLNKFSNYNSLGLTIIACWLLYFLLKKFIAKLNE